MVRNDRSNFFYSGDEFRLGDFAPLVDRRLSHWESVGFGRRLWAKDPTLWSAEPLPEIPDRLGWLDLPRIMPERLDAILAFAAEIRAEEFRHIVLLGMGGSSLAPEVFQKTFGSAAGFPALAILDSTHPAAVAAAEAKIDPARTLFVVSSKSGTTVEPLSFFRYFWAKAGGIADSPGRHFIAISDPGTPLLKLAGDRKFRRTFQARPDVGGRFSALTEFGLVPAALIGVDIHGLLDRARRAAEADGAAAAESRAPGLRLGAALGELGLRRNKLTLLTSPSLSSFPDWLEQLIAESLGKDGKGILPVAGEPIIPIEGYGGDRIFVAFLMDGDRDIRLDRHLAALEKAGFPTIRIRLRDSLDLGREIVRWELAVAAAGAVLGVQPFNQPDVELAKLLARDAMAGHGVKNPAWPSGDDVKGRAFAAETDPRAKPGVSAAVKNPAAPSGNEVVSAEDAVSLRQAIDAWLSHARRGDYAAIQAYLAPDAETTRALQSLRLAFLQKTGLATTLGFGPRFLHSTGQYHKGGPDEGMFLQFIDEPARDLAVPETGYTFGGLIRAQAQGDALALRQSGRRILRIDLKGDVAGGLNRVRGALAD